MKTVLITGVNGFIGSNLATSLSQTGNVEILKFGKENTPEQLRELIAKADFVYHLAGDNRPLNPQEFDSGNRGLTELLLDCIQENGRNIPVLLSSSIQVSLDNAYGMSKKDAEELVKNYAVKTGAKVYVYRLPNVFGKWCRPNYNSVVATFCHNIATHQPIQIHDRNTELNLVYIDDVIEEFTRVLNEIDHRDVSGHCSVERTFKVKLGDLADTLYSFQGSRDSLVVHNLAGDFERFLYATYLSYLDESNFSYALEMKQDHRGWLAEFIKSDHLGQIFISRTKPGITRGNHWHHTKVEKFLVIDGEAIIKFRHVNADFDIEYHVTGNELKVLDIPPGYAHSITNIGDSDVLTLFWASEIFDTAKSDTYYLEV
ncbi:NAD-dependent epimerase/dehydratase family protein [Paenibacillus terrigena]|uniref:polysaccharide biosynthesis C-terminal domain-containing protein n=1 Tax=Paenibacillus terrigena TaxID=369333 RepID=UPI000380817A|nr:NAD-dependent epimerase/dehydratase family protein [Paenibacillus terrigena]